MLKRPAVALLTALASISVFASCGSGGDDTVATVQLTKVELIKQGDAICRKADQQQAAALLAYAEDHSLSVANKAGQEKAILAVGLVPIQTEAEELDALAPPEGDEEKLEAIVHALEEVVENSEEDPSKLVTGPSPYKEVDALAGEYGFKVCASHS